MVGEKGQLGLNDYCSQRKPLLVSSLSNLVRVISVAAGLQHTLALTSTGKVFSFGDNSRMQLGKNHLQFFC